MLIVGWIFVAVFVVGGISYAFQTKAARTALPRLHIWYRAGIVISLLWIPITFFWQMELENAQNWEQFRTAYSACRDDQDRSGNPHPNTQLCMNEAQQTYRIFALDDRETSETIAFVPVIGGWILAFLSLWTTRWVLAGRRKEQAA